MLTGRAMVMAEPRNDFGGGVRIQLAPAGGLFVMMVNFTTLDAMGYVGVATSGTPLFAFSGAVLARRRGGGVWVCGSVSGKFDLANGTSSDQGDFDNFVVGYNERLEAVTATRLSVGV